MAEEQNKTFLLPPPKFKDEIKQSLDKFNRHLNPHFSTPNGMLLPREKQPPPMYGPRGSTVPPQFMGNTRKRAAPWAPGLPNSRQGPPGDRGNYQRPPYRHPGGHNNRPPRPHNNGLEKDVKPELLVLDWKLWCEGCDVNCRSEDEYQRHLLNHTPCAVSGCKFIGHPMVMKRHERQAHKETPGTTKEQVAGPSQEEIDQWKEERRKRFPTKQNVILRQQAQEARFNRGERIEENRERFPNRHASRENDEKRTPVGNGRFTKRPKRRKRSKANVCAPIVEESSGRKGFAGTSSLEDYKDPTKNALGMLGEYGTDSENGSDGEDSGREVNCKQDASEVPIESASSKYESVLSDGEIVDGKTSESVITPVPVLAAIRSNGAENECVVLGTDKIARLDECANEQPPPTNNSMNPSTSHIKEKDNNCGVRSTKMENPQHSNVATGQRQRHRNMPKTKAIGKANRSLLDYSKLRRANQNTMLEKLLDVDIRHERNVLLQCVRHVLEKKFFGIGQPNETLIQGGSEEG